MEGDKKCVTVNSARGMVKAVKGNTVTVEFAGGDTKKLAVDVAPLKRCSHG